MDIETVDVVVVGSGFGGSVIACRLAEQQRSVVVLERGKKYGPGDFPRRPDQMRGNFWDPSEGLHGLFDIWSFRSTEAVVAAGLGGGSLIYANVMLRKPEKWFVRDGGPGDGYEVWPVSLADLDPFYATAERVLGATDNPYPYDDTPKTNAFERAARRLDIEVTRPNLAVSFAPPTGRPGQPVEDSASNVHGAVRSTCRLCGECDVGCNYGAKNTLDYTYLSRAEQSGADLRVRSEVRHIAPLPGGCYEVHYVRHHEDNEGAPVDTSRLQPVPIRCRVLVLAAGALGTSYLLLRCQDAFPGLSPALGTCVSGNGDLLGFIHDSAARLQPSYGPVITSTAFVPDDLDGGTGRGFFLQEGGYPLFVDWMLESVSAVGVVGRTARFAGSRVLAALTGHPRSDIGAQVGSLIGDGRASSGNLPLLGIGRDVADGRFRLRAGYLDLVSNPATSVAYYARLAATMEAFARECSGEFQHNPTRLLQRLITVHPLGGAPMAHDARRGVVDAHGEVFGWPGMFVADGAVMPGPVGANPSLTIAALAERFSERVLERVARA